MPRNGDWQIVAGQALRYYEDPLAGAPDKARYPQLVGTYELTPGNAHTYNEGILHSPWRTGPAKMIRIEGGPIESEGRVAYEVVA